jgi:hypothetical protein
MAEHNPSKIPKMNIIEDYVETPNISNGDIRNETGNGYIEQVVLRSNLIQENEQNRPDNVGNMISVGLSDISQEQVTTENSGLLSTINYSDLETEEALQHAIDQSLQLEFDYCLKGLNSMNDLVREITPEARDPAEINISERSEINFCNALSDIDFTQMDGFNTELNDRKTAESRLYKIDNVETITLLVNGDSRTRADTDTLRQINKKERRDSRDANLIRNSIDSCAKHQSLCRLCQQRFGEEQLESRISQINYKINDLYTRVDNIFERLNWRYE